MSESVVSVTALNVKEQERAEGRLTLERSPMRSSFNEHCLRIIKIDIP